MYNAVPKVSVARQATVIGYAYDVRATLDAKYIASVGEC